MQVFFLSNKTGEENKGLDSLKGIFTESKDAIPVSGMDLRIFYRNHHLSYYSANGDFIANNGVFVYKDEFNKNGIKRFYEDLNSGVALKELLLRAHGQFFLVLYLKGDLMVITDRFRTIPVFLLKTKNTVQISNLYYLLTKNNDASYTVNFDYLSQNLSWQRNTSHIFSDSTLFNEISYLEPGCIYHLANGAVNSEKYYDIKRNIEFGKYKNLKTVVDDLIGILDSNYRFLENIEKIFCCITGGFDTRLNLSTLLKKKKQFLCGHAVLDYEAYLKKGRFADFRIVDRFIREFGLNYKNLGTDLKNVKEWVEEYKEPLKFIKYDAAAFHRYHYYDSVSQIADIELSGFGGSEFLTKDCHLYFRQNKKFEKKEFLKAQKYNDILLEKYYDKKKYYFSLERYVEGLIGNITYTQRGDLLTYLIYTSPFMNNYNNYVASVNMFCPAYSPYYEPGFLKIMMETPYRLKGFHGIQRHLYSRIMDRGLAHIDTTHGYPATTITKRNFYRFWRILNPVDPNLQYHPLFKRFKKEIYNFAIGIILPYVYRCLKYLKLGNRLKLDSIDAYVKIIEESNLVNKFLDATKLRKRIMNIRLRAAIKEFSEKTGIYLQDKVLG